MPSENPLSTAKFRAFQASNWLVNNPAHTKEAAIHLLVSRGNYTRAEAEIQVSSNPAVANDEKAYAVWSSNTPAYLTRDIHKALGVLTPYTKWRWRYQLPVAVSACEAAFLIREMQPSYLTPTEKGHLNALFDEPPEGVKDHARQPRHPKGFTVVMSGEGRLKSKVGRTYGSWKLESCLSTTENTASGAKVIYRCRCTQCGTQRDIAYHSLRAVVCKSCGMRKTAGRSMDPIVLYISADGRVMRPYSVDNVPAEAVALVRLSEYDSFTELVPMTQKAIKANLLLQPVQDHEGEVKAVLKPEEAEPVKPHDPHDIPLPTADDLVGLDELPDMEGF